MTDILVNWKPRILVWMVGISVNWTPRILVYWMAHILVNWMPRLCWKSENRPQNSKYMESLAGQENNPQLVRLSRGLLHEPGTRNKRLGVR